MTQAKSRTKRLANRVDLSISAAVVNAAVGTTDFGGVDQFGNAGVPSVGGYAGYTLGTYGGGCVPNDILSAKRAVIEVGADESDGQEKDWSQPAEGNSHGLCKDRW